MSLKSIASHFFHVIAKIILYIFSPIIIPIIKYIAVTGRGTDNCLKHGFLPVRVHYYQPIPDILELEKRNVWDLISKKGGVRFEPEKYIKSIKQLAATYADECNWPNEQTSNPKDFHLYNGRFSYGCASTLHCIIRCNKPNNIIEIGSGHSSKIISAAIKLNQIDGYKTNYTIIDPYSKLDKQNFPTNTKIIKRPIELMNLSIFESLEENDILFIDSSHVCKIGSDVNFEILEILPSLNIGVLIHFHDIPFPFEYPKTYSTNPKFRVFWNESYLLQAFLICNSDFQISLPMSYLQKYHLLELEKAFPHSLKTDFSWVSGSFWIKRISKFVNK